MNVPFMAWLLLGYFRTIPVELEDAARIDGCSRAGVLWRLVLPLALPGIVAAFIFGFVNSWNEFLYAAVMVQRNELRTIPVGLYSFKIGDVMLWGPLMASAVLVTLPVAILFMFVQRYFVQGLTVGAVKG
jgi:multiple sugar transport system permease protein